MNILDITSVRESFAETVNRVSYAKERTAISRRGKVVAALVSADDLELLEAINAHDLKEARAAIAAAKANGEKPVAWTQAKKRLGI